MLIVGIIVVLVLLAVVWLLLGILEELKLLTSAAQSVRESSPPLLQELRTAQVKLEATQKTVTDFVRIIGQD
jgi:hypothetical protein